MVHFSALKLHNAHINHFSCNTPQCIIMPDGLLVKREAVLLVNELRLKKHFFTPDPAMQRLL